MTHLGLPPDAVAWSALGAAALALAAALAKRRALARLVARIPAPALVTLLALAAALLSAGYVAFYLRGGPRIIDATSYFLEGRALSRGELTFSTPAPTASFRGRFLLSTPGGERLAVIFPPGYPALLALGFLGRAPLAVGPLLAALLVAMTFLLTKALTGRRDVALLAALLSALSAALRYHTADTMSHGLAALLFAALVTAALQSGIRAALLAGLAAGWLIATRPVTGAIGVGVALAILRAERRSLLAFTAALAPGLALLALHQHAATGAWLGSTQRAYYSVSDGPPGCFRYGLGAGIGCLYEHGDFVRARLRDGYDFAAAAGTTGRRLFHHLIDAGNSELFALPLIAGLLLSARVARLRWAAVVVVGLVLAYAPFYFDGDYPGGGARFFADALPFEHALIAWAMFRFRAARFTAPLLLAGFALRASYEHRALAEREGGRPMFEPGALAARGIAHGLVFVETDHGFNLGHAPGAHDATRALVVARARHDARDAARWDSLGRPPSYLYRYDPSASRATPSIEPYLPPPLTRSAPLVFESEAEWPALAVTAGSAYPSYSAASSVSRGRGLGLHPVRGRARVALELYAPRSGRYELRAFVAPLDAPIGGELTLSAGGRRWTGSVSVSAGACSETPPLVADLAQGSQRLEVDWRGGAVLLDRVEATLAAGRDPKP
ncbi:MAG: hypothetical protein OZ921_06785 [Sorangiineae bacterium]|nr:hypothetical protein [Sorangiineae bacterium]